MSRAEAVEAMARAVMAWMNSLDREPMTTQGFICQQAEVALDALLSPSTTTCETCSGTGYVDGWPTDGSDAITDVLTGENVNQPPRIRHRCPAGYDHGQVHREPYMVLRSDLVRSVRWSEEAGYSLYNLRLRTPPGEREEESS